MRRRKADSAKLDSRLKPAQEVIFHEEEVDLDLEIITTISNWTIMILSGKARDKSVQESSSVFFLVAVRSM